MTKATEREGFDLPSWKFRVTRLGCVESGEIEVKPLTLLCGPNNTGKTWVMYALYGMLKNTLPENFHDLPELEEVIDTLKLQRSCSWNFVDWLENHSQKLISLINQDIQTKLPAIFNAPDEVFEGCRIERVLSPEQIVKDGLNLVLDVSYGSGMDVVVIKHANEPNIRITIVGQVEDIGFWVYASVFGNFLLGPDVFLLPAERNGLNLFYRELRERRTRLMHPLYRSLLRDTGDVIGSRYPTPIADYIDFLNSLHRNKSGNFIDAAERIKKLVSGRYDVDSEGNIGFIPNQVTKKHDSLSKLDLHLTSSTVTSLFGLWFYLEHQAKPGDVLMIDEPELNLHPANQRAVARVLARLVNAGIRVVCSTHSDYIVREINSLIMLSRPHPKREELMQRFGYEEEELLKPEQVGAYVFDNGRIDAMPITDDEGIEAKTFDQQIHELNETSDKIYYTYRDSEAEETP